MAKIMEKLFDNAFGRMFYYNFVMEHISNRYYRESFIKKYLPSIKYMEKFDAFIADGYNNHLHPYDVADAIIKFEDIFGKI